jgi:glycolate oxidase iron-sulfur subunit
MTAARQHIHEFEQAVGPRAEDLARCVHCGFCLQACPTYVITSLENVVQHFDLCLQCRACETACPSGVPYGRIIEGARALVQSSPQRPRSWRLRTAVLRLMFARKWRLKLAFSALRVYQKTPLAAIARRVLPGRLRQMEAMLPKLPERFFEPPLVLARNGFRVLVPKEQGCCGALHVHNGDPGAARVLARQNIDVFLGSGADYVVVNAAGCGSAMKEYADLFEGDDTWSAKAHRFVESVRDVTELLSEVGFVHPTGRIEQRVTYQDSCCGQFQGWSS